MNRIVFIAFLISFVCQCKSKGEVPFNFDTEARALQDKINDKSYTFYHEKHPPRIEMPVVITPDFRAQRELRAGSFVYRLQIDDKGKFTHRAIKPPPAFFEPHLLAILNALSFKPGWIGPKNFTTELDIHFIMEYEAY
jgi:hypothetical protein